MNDHFLRPVIEQGIGTDLIAARVLVEEIIVPEELHTNPEVDLWVDRCTACDYFSALLISFPQYRPTG
jgi:hypothetical protein